MDVNVFAEFVQHLNSIGHIDLLLKVGDTMVAAEKWKKRMLIVYPDGTWMLYNDSKRCRADGLTIYTPDGAQTTVRGRRPKKMGPAWDAEDERVKTS